MINKGACESVRDISTNYNFYDQVNKVFSETLEIGNLCVNGTDYKIINNYQFFEKLKNQKTYLQIATDVESRKILEQVIKKAKLEIQQQGIWGLMFYHRKDNLKYYTYYLKIQDFISDILNLGYHKGGIQKIVIGVCNLEYEGIAFDGYLSKLLKIKTGIKRNPNGLRPWSAEYKLPNKITLEIIDVQRIFTSKLDVSGEMFFGKGKYKIDLNKAWIEFDNLEIKEESQLIKYNLQDCNITLGLMTMAECLNLSGKRKIAYTMGGVATKFFNWYLQKTGFLEKDQEFIDRKKEGTYYILKDATHGAYCESLEMGDIIKNTDFSKYNLYQVDFVNQYGSVCCRDNFPDPRCASVKVRNPDFWNKEGNVEVEFLKFIKIPQPIIGYKLCKEGKTKEETQQNERKIFSDHVKGRFNLIYPEMRYLINACNLKEGVDYEIVVAIERERAPYQFMKDFFEAFSNIRNENFKNKAMVQLCKDIPNALTGKFGQHVQASEDAPWFSDPLFNAYILFGGRNMLFENMQIIQDQGGEIIKSVTDSIMFRIPKNVNIYDILPITDKKILGCVNIEHEFTHKDKVFVASAKRYIINNKLTFSSFAAPKENFGYEKFLQEVDQGYSVDEKVNPVKTTTMKNKYQQWNTGEYFIWQTNTKIFKFKISRGLKYNNKEITCNCKIVGIPWRISVKGFAYNHELESKS